jgi:type IV pilus biogenesis protein CpaD/CtpE
MRALIRLTAVGAIAALAGACTTAQKPLASNWGSAMRQTIAAQTADPEPQYTRELEPASDGQRAADASKRYKTGKPTAPVTQTTSQVGGGGGGGPQ